MMPEEHDQTKVGWQSLDLTKDTVLLHWLLQPSQQEPPSPAS